jgi:PIN domain nuclease of toxin-antitoxin system
VNLLLDTCTFLWILGDDPALSRTARDAFRDPANEVFLSAVSVWEILIKHRLGRLPLPDPVGAFIQEQRERHEIAALVLDEEAVLQLPRLPDHHRDPFDRMLVCQSIAHGFALLTPDQAIRQYPVRTLW